MRIRRMNGRRSWKRCSGRRGAWRESSDSIQWGLDMAADNEKTKRRERIQPTMSEVNYEGERRQFTMRLHTTGCWGSRVICMEQSGIPRTPIAADEAHEPRSFKNASHGLPLSQREREIDSAVLRPTIPCRSPVARQSEDLLYMRIRFAHRVRVHQRPAVIIQRVRRPFLQRIKDGIADRPLISTQVCIPKSQHLDPVALQESVSQCVITPLLGISMHPSI